MTDFAVSQSEQFSRVKRVRRTFDCRSRTVGLMEMVGSKVTIKISSVKVHRVFIKTSEARSGCQEIIEY